MSLGMLLPSCHLSCGPRYGTREILPQILMWMCRPACVPRVPARGCRDRPWKHLRKRRYGRKTAGPPLSHLLFHKCFCAERPGRTPAPSRSLTLGGQLGTWELFGTSLPGPPEWQIVVEGTLSCHGHAGVPSPAGRKSLPRKHPSSAQLGTRRGDCEHEMNSVWLSRLSF